MSDTRKQIMERLGSIVSTPGAKSKFANEEQQVRALIGSIGAKPDNVIYKNHAFELRYYGHAGKGDGEGRARRTLANVHAILKRNGLDPQGAYYQPIDDRDPSQGGMIVLLASTFDKPTRASRPGAKAKFAIPPQVMQSWNFHTSKMTDLLRQFENAARKSFGNRFDPNWLAEHASIIRSAISALHNGRVKESTKQMRSWADDFTRTYANHEHTRNLAMLAREIAREPAHVLELAESHGVKMSRPGEKAKMAKRYDAKIVGNELVRSDGRRYQIKGRKPSLPKAREINGEVEWLFITGENGAEYSVQRFDDSGYRVFGGSSGMSVQWDGLLRASRPGAKAKMAANESEVRKAISSDIAEMMRVWNKIMATAKKQFPNASSEELYQIALGAMKQQLKMSRPGTKSTHATDEAVSKKIALLMDEGYPQEQAVAIALDMKRKGTI